MARKPHEPTDKDRKQVTLMAGIGLTHDQIAKIVGVSDETLRKYYGEELETAASKMNAQVAQNLFSIATSKAPGSVAAACFWMKTRAGWKETIKADVEVRHESTENLSTFLTLLEKARVTKPD
jgi:hypothetical protein